MKIAFATTDRVNVDAHFGWAQEIDVYEISASGYNFVETLKFDGKSKKVEVETKQDESKIKTNKDSESDDKVAAKLEALADCAIVYVASIGGIPAAKLIKQGVMPVRPHSEQEDIAFILNKLVQTLQGNPPPWLRKALQK
ncbi:nitrogen fixation protein NifX [Chlorogloeopsis sp. ULAP01]|uniref:nitrogen fixation protein NifX n=1 Tax=Chlorogloeopsis sp. ULAP01 TaxID=3056483 RepID=UPI0025AABFD0|nr:nitrogen fixation protein NifX [Chlorogloeopsis sp. ULAP01]MDM9382464.1 nitrogen fixation protein NifX [Chlorogloeopsis sp. ULAP01]